MNYTLQQLRYLVAVADYGSVSAAARSLYVSQPGVSAAISHLESAFGIQCFIRHHARGVTLTDAGFKFVGSAKKLLAEAEELKHHARELSHAETSSLRIGCLSTIGPVLLPRILPALRAETPHLKVRVQDGNTATMITALREKTIDVALMYDLGCDPDLYTKLHLATLYPYAALPTAHPLSRKAKLAPRELVNEPSILLNSDCAADHVLSLFEGAKQTDIRCRVSSMELMNRLVAAGEGYAIVYLRDDARLYSQESVGKGGMDFVKYVPIASHVPPLEMILATVHAQRVPAGMDMLTDVCRSLMECFDTAECRWIA